MTYATVPGIRPVRSDADLEAATVRAMALSEEAEGGPLSEDGQDELEILLVLIRDYEERTGYRIKDARTVVERIEGLMREEGMNANALGRLLGQRQLGSAILLGRRELSKRHIALLAAHFHVSPALFFGQGEAG